MTKGDCDGTADWNALAAREQADRFPVARINGKTVRYWPGEGMERRRLAATGVCPDCGAAMDVDPACEVSDPPHDGPTRTTRAALCGACECCVEL
ncbi:MAG TPA: hypothetical protein VFN64_09580 [Burkholderiaceae bacterium]|nr:hypothetical protein [Burkholderiaceae bacterium]